MKEVNVKKLLLGKASENTIESYVVAWNTYRKFCGSMEAALDPKSLVEWREYLINVAGMASGSIINRINGVRRIIRELNERGQVTDDVVEEFYRVKSVKINSMPERKRPHNRTRITPEQMREMIDATKVDLKNPILARDRAVLLTLATSGMRSSEVCGVKTEDVLELSNGYVIDNIRVKGGRTRRVPISKECYEAIHDWLFLRPVKSQWVFTTQRIHNPFIPEEDTYIVWNNEPMNRKGITEIVNKYANIVGIKYVKPHDFRRFVGTTLAQKNVRLAQKVLGHKHITTTVEHYLLDEVEPGVTEGLF